MKFGHQILLGIFALVILFSIPPLQKSFFYSGNVYYVSNAGNDGANGLTPGTAWRTLAKVNATSFIAGDTIKFNRGDTWNEPFKPLVGGLVGLPIVYDAYGTGIKPLITGFQTLALSNLGSNIWGVTATNAVKSPMVVSVGGVLKGMARTPNTGFSTFTSVPANNQIVTSLTGTPNYTGSLLVVKDAHWILDLVRITSQSGGTLTFNPPTTYGTLALSLAANGFFLMGNVSDLDIQNEWQMDSTTKAFKLFSTITPAQVQISTIDTLVWISKQSYLTFNNLAFTGANKMAFKIDTAARITIQNCLLDNNGGYAICAQKCPRLKVLKDTITHTLSTAILAKNLNTDIVNGAMAATCDSLKVDSCYINYTGFIAGMGNSANGEYMATYTIGNVDTITNNVTKNTGYAVHYWNGRKNFIAYNLVDTFCYVKDDGGAIYTYAASASFSPNYDSGSLEHKNIVLHGIGQPLGTTTSTYEAAGIYIDDNVTWVTSDSSGVFGCNLGDFFTYGENSHINIYDNVFDDSLSITGTMTENISITTNSNLKRNVFYQRNPSFKSFYIKATNTGMGIDSNFYIEPTNESLSLQMGATSYNLASWQSATGYDTHGKITPPNIISSVGTFLYNPTHQNVSFLCTTNSVDGRGKVYNVGSYLILHEFESMILFNLNTLPYLINRHHKILP